MKKMEINVNVKPPDMPLTKMDYVNYVLQEMLTQNLTLQKPLVFVKLVTNIMVPNVFNVQMEI